MVRAENGILKITKSMSREREKKGKEEEEEEEEAGIVASSEEIIRYVALFLLHLPPSSIAFHRASVRKI